MKARPTLTNPKVITSTSQGTYTAWWNPGDNSTNYQYKHWFFDGEGGDVWLELGKLDGGIDLTNFKNAVIIGNDLCNTTKGSKALLVNGKYLQSVGSNKVDVLNIKNFTGVAHVEGCIVDSNYNRADCIRWINSGASSTVVVQCCIFKHGYQTGDQPGHGDLIQAQGGDGSAPNLYVEKFVGYQAGQGFQLPYQPAIAGGKGIKHLDIRECILTFKNAEYAWAGNTFLIGLPNSSAIPPSAGSVFSEFYLDTKYNTAAGQTTDRNTVLEKLGTWGNDSRVIENTDKSVRFNFPSPYTVSGVIAPNNVDDYCPVLESKCGVNYSRSYYENPTNGSEVSFSAVLGTSIGLTAIMTTTGVIPTDDVPPNTITDIPSPPDEPTSGVIHDLSATINSEIGVNSRMKLILAGAGQISTEISMKAGLSGDMGIYHTGASKFYDAAFSSEFGLSGSLNIESDQVPPEDPGNPPEDPGEPGEPDIPPAPPTPPPAPDTSAEYYDTVTIRAPLANADMKLKFRQYARPSSIDYFTLIDTLYPPRIDAIRESIDFLQGILYVESSTSVRNLYTETAGYSIIDMETTAEFLTLVSGIDYDIYATSASIIKGTVGVDGSSDFTSSPLISLIPVTKGGRFSSTGTNFYTDQHGRVIDTTVNSTSVAFYSVEEVTTGLFTDLNIVDSSAVKNCQRIEFFAGPFISKIDCEHGIRIGSSSSNVETTGYMSWAKVVDGTGIKRTNQFIHRSGITPGKNFYFNGSLTKLNKEGGNLYHCDVQCHVSGGSENVARGWIELDKDISTIKFFTETTNGASASPSRSKLFYAGWRGANVDAIRIPTVNYRHVFVWNALNQPVYGVTEDDYKREVALAKQYGFDGFGVEMFGTPTTMNAARELIKAAEATTDFYLYPIIRWNSDWTPDNIQQMIHEFYNSPVGWFYKGKLVVATYGSPVDQTWWDNNVFSQLADVGVECFFMPFIGTDEDEYSQTVTDGATLYTCTDVTGDATRALGFYSVEGSARPTQYGFAPAYWEVPSDVVRDAALWDHHGYTGMSYGFNTLIRNEPVDRGFTTLITWNDFGRDTYYCPGTAPAFYRNLDIPSFSHRGFTRLASHYIKWYKERQEPVVSKEFACVAYRQHYCSVSVPSTDELVEWNRNLVFYKGGVEVTANAVKDYIHVTTVLNRPAKAKVITVDGTVSAQVGAGVTHTYAPLASGNPEIQVWRNNNMFLQLVGEVTITTSAPTVTRNYHTYADYTEGLI